jgi:hypothetical protein
VAALTAARTPTGTPGLDIALGWHVWTANGKEIVWHNGGTGGYRTFIGYDPKARVGVVALSNASTRAGTDDIGRHLLDRQTPLLAQNSPLVTPPKTRTEIAVDPKLFDGYVGRYQFAPAALLTITRDANRLFVQLTDNLRSKSLPKRPKTISSKWSTRRSPSRRTHKARPSPSSSIRTESISEPPESRESRWCRKR